MNLRLTVLMIAALLQALAGGFRISGRVLDGETGKPIANAVVVLSRTDDAFKQTVTVGTDGLFQFVNVPRGPYQLHTQHPNPVVPYRGQSLDIDLTRDLENMGMILSPAVSRVAIAGKVVVIGGEPLPRAISSILFSNEAVAVQPDGSFQTRLRPAQHYEVVIPNAPEGFYVESVSGGTWNRSSSIWIFRDAPRSPIEVVLGVGRLRMSGRVVDASGNPAPQASVTVTGPAPENDTRTVALNTAGTFSIGGLRSGDYELRARMGTGDAVRAAFLRVPITTANRANLELAVKAPSPVTGQIVVTPSGTVSELVRFNLSVEVEDAMGTRTVRVDSKGAFQFRSFEPDYVVTVKDLPIGLRVDSVSKDSGSVEIRLKTIQGDVFPGLRLNDRR